MNGLTVVLSDGINLSKLSDRNLGVYYETEFSAAERDADFAKLQISCNRLCDLAGNTVKNMVQMGKELAQIRDTRVYRSCSKMSKGIEVGYSRFDDFCKGILEISPTKAKDAIRLYEKFTVDGDDVKIKDEYVGYTVSKLIELASMPEEEHARINPSMSVQEIREIKHELKNPALTSDILPGQLTLDDVTEPMSEDEPAEEAKNGQTSDHSTPQFVYEILRHGTGYEHGKFRVMQEYARMKRSENEYSIAKDFAAFLKDEYGLDGFSDGTYKCNHSSKGIEFVYHQESVYYTWQKVAALISDLIEKDDYLTEPQRIQYHMEYLPSHREPDEQEKNSPTSDHLTDSDEEFYYGAPASDDEEESYTADVTEPMQSSEPDEQEKNSPTSDQNTDIAYKSSSAFMRYEVFNKLERLAAYMGVKKSVIVSYALQEYVEGMFIGLVLNSSKANFEKKEYITPFLKSDKFPAFLKGDNT